MTSSWRPLARDDLEELIADSLQCERQRAEPLAELVAQKTTGNPFFAIQFFAALAEEALLAFDYGAGQWSWDLGRIHAKGYTDNVVDLMVAKLHRLPIATQRALQQLACLGNSADVATLRMVCQGSIEEMHGRLWEAVRTGLVFRSEESYRFLHDRVQEAAYSLIPREWRAEAHLRIGRLLVAHVPPDKREDAIFEIVGQLNCGNPANILADEREQIAELNLMAARRARASTAYASSLRYVRAGMTLLSEEHWQRRHDLVFELELHRAECEFLTGAVSDAARRLELLSTRAASTVEHAAIACLRVDVHMSRDQVDIAISVCLDYLRMQGIEWSSHPSKDEARHAYDRIAAQLEGRAIEDLIELPLIVDFERARDAQCSLEARADAHTAQPADPGHLSRGCSGTRVRPR